MVWLLACSLADDDDDVWVYCKTVSCDSQYRARARSIAINSGVHKTHTFTSGISNNAVQLMNSNGYLPVCTIELHSNTLFLHFFTVHSSSSLLMKFAKIWRHLFHPLCSSCFDSSHFFFAFCLASSTVLESTIQDAKKLISRRHLNTSYFSELHIKCSRLVTIAW